MQCKTCNGTGAIPNPAHYTAKHEYTTDYYLLIPSKLKCSECKGIGFTIENTKQALPYLRQLEKRFSHLKDNKVDLLLVQQIINIIEK